MAGVGAVERKGAADTTGGCAGRAAAVTAGVGALRHCREYRFEWILPLRTTLV